MGHAASRGARTDGDGAAAAAAAGSSAQTADTVALQEFVRELAPDGTATTDAFDKAFDYPSWADFARRLRHSSWAVRDKTELTAAEIEGLLGPLFEHVHHDSNAFLADVFRIFAGGETMGVQMLTELMATLLNWTLVLGGWPLLDIDSAPAPIVASLCAGLLENKCGDVREVASADFVKWANDAIPRIARGARAVFDATIMHAPPPPAIALGVPVLDTKGNKETLITIESALALSLSLPDMYLTSGVWTLLYNSAHHGQAGNRFQHHCYLYRGPTLVVVKDSENNVYAVAADEEWRERNAPWGKDDCRLYRVLPSFRLVSKDVKLYDNIKTRHMLHGIGFGSAPQSPDTASLWLEPDLSTGRTACAAGYVLGVSREVKIWRVEVWGCGDAGALSSQEREKLRDRQAAEHRAKAQRPKAEEWQDSPDRLLLAMAGALKLDKLDEESRVSTDRSK